MNWFRVEVTESDSDDGRTNITFLLTCCGPSANVAAISLLRRVEELRDDGFEVDLGRYDDAALVKIGDDCRRLYICSEGDLEKLVAMIEKREAEERDI